jgi:putative endonuclease
MIRNSATPFYVYILKCSDGTLYTGYTSDLPNRIKKHNAGSGSKYVRSRRPATLVYQEPCPDKSSAMKRERAIKNLSRANKMALILICGFTKFIEDKNK